MLQAIIDVLGLAEDRVLRLVDRIGSVGAASIPTTLDALWRSGRVAPGERVLMVGVGAGISYGAIVLQVDG
jgi:3-oxoacyl-[acyl-carrier-protein] synthase III